MKRREVLALIIFFAMTTAALTPTAYRLGVTHGTAFAAIAPVARPNLSKNGATSGPITTRRLTAQDCPSLGLPGGIARSGIEIDCLPSAGAHSEPAFAAAPNLSSETRTGADAGNLTTAMVSAITNGQAGTTGGQRETVLGSPIGLALAPDVKPGAAGLFPSSGLPDSLIPLGLTSQAPPPGNNPPGDGPSDDPPADPIDDPIDDPFEDLPDMVVPLPAGLPLMLTGLLGLFAASRKK
jgi:hypothetical protein